MKGKAKVCLLFLIAGLLPIIIVEGISYGVLFYKRNAWKEGHLIKDSKAVELSLPDNEKNLLKKKLASLAPIGNYIVVDTARNLLFLKQGEEILKKAIVSCGSGNVLSEPNGQRKWTFDTPRGVFEVKYKIKNPCWIKPDWAFIEEGKEIPKDRKQRIETDVLGDYALGFGNGFFIHGTLYTRLLGRNVTHGCIRVADEDLSDIYSKSSLGTKIFIF